MFEFELACSQWQGKRAYQQDTLRAHYYPDGSVLAVLADGMGGAKGGEVASLAAVNAVFEAYTSDNSDIEAQLLQLAGKANNAVAKKVKQSPDLKGMGTTLLVVVIREDQLYWLSIGDSPLYHVSNDKIDRINLDESYGGHLDRLAECGRISTAEALSDKRRHQLMNVLMGHASLTVEDCNDEGFSLDSGDVIVLASDGLQTLTDDEIKQEINAQNRTAEEINHELLTLVSKRAKPKQDNVSLVCIRVKNEDKS